MRRFKILALLLVLLYSTPARAQERSSDAPVSTGDSLQKPLDLPKTTIRRRVFDKKFLVVTAVSVGVSIGTSFAVNKCRHDHGIGPCQEGGYGEFKTREGLRQGLTGFLILPSWKLKQIEESPVLTGAKDNGQGAKHKFWWLFPAANAGFNAAIIAQNKFKHYGPRDHDRDR